MFGSFPFAADMNTRAQPVSVPSHPFDTNTINNNIIYTSSSAQAVAHRGVYDASGVHQDRSPTKRTQHDMESFSSSSWSSPSASKRRRTTNDSSNSNYNGCSSDKRNHADDHRHHQDHSWNANGNQENVLRNNFGPPMAARRKLSHRHHHQPQQGETPSMAHGYLSSSMIQHNGASSYSINNNGVAHGQFFGAGGYPHLK